MKHFGINKTQAREVIKKLVEFSKKGSVVPCSQLGICFNMKSKEIDWREIFKELGYKNVVYPLGRAWYMNMLDLWDNSTVQGRKRRKLCLEVVDLLKKEFSI